MLVPYNNRTAKPVRIGSVVVPPGQMRDVDAAALATPVASPAPVPSAFSAESLLTSKVADVIAALDDLTADQLKKLKDCEERADKPRTSLITELSTRIVSLAAGTTDNKE